MNNSTYPGNELDIFKHAYNWKEYFSRHIRPYINGHVIEVGAGIGGTTRTLSCSNFKSWTCLEPDPHLVNKLSAFIDSNDRYDDYKLVTGELSDIDTPACYDTILYIDVLEHIENDAGELNRAVNFLSTNGTLVILSPAYQWLFSEFDEAIGHFRRYTKQTLTATIPPELEPVCIRYLDSVGVIASLANRILLHKSTPSTKQIVFWDKTIVPCSRVLDPLIQYSFGKSILGIWRKK